jgi:transposase InsO family protein
VGRNFRPAAPNLVWAADIKQIRTGEGWLYLAAVQDLFSAGSSVGAWPRICNKSRR